MRRLGRPNFPFQHSRSARWLTTILVTALVLGAAAALASCSTDSAPRVETDAAPVAFVVGTDGAPTRDEIAALVPYAVRLPAWVPEGYELQPEIGYAMQEAALLLEWRQPAGGEIDLVVGPNSPTLPDAPAHVTRKTTVNDQPALLIFGMSDGSEVGWNPHFHLMLVWQQDEVHYLLAATGRGTTRQALLEMAESFS